MKNVRDRIQVEKQIIAEYESGMHVYDLALELLVPKSTICMILKNKDATKASNVAKGMRVLTRQ